MTKTEKSEIYRLRGNAAVQGGDLPGAAQAYTEALKACPQNVAAYANRAAVHLHMGDDKKAEGDASIALVMAPAKDKSKQALRLKAYFRRALARKGLKKYQAALDDLAAVLKAEGRYVEDVY